MKLTLQERGNLDNILSLNYYRMYIMAFYKNEIVLNNCIMNYIADPLCVQYTLNHLQTWIKSCYIIRFNYKSK